MAMIRPIAYWEFTFCYEIRENQFQSLLSKAKKMFFSGFPTLPFVFFWWTNICLASFYRRWGSELSKSNDEHAASEQAVILARPSADFGLNNTENDQYIYIYN